jgi:hypothetical protein
MIKAAEDAQVVAATMMMIVYLQLSLSDAADDDDDVDDAAAAAADDVKGWSYSSIIRWRVDYRPDAPMPHISHVSALRIYSPCVCDLARCLKTL